MKSFDISNLNDLLSHLPAINVIDSEPDEAKSFLLQTYENSISVTGAELIQGMMGAIINKTQGDFRRKYCELPFLIIMLDKEEVCKTALQDELAFILDVRSYKELPTVLLSKDRIISYPLTNKSFLIYARAYDTIRK